MNLLNKYITNYFFIAAIYIIFFIGFIFKNYSAGGSKNDFYTYTWNGISEFKSDLLNSVINYSEIIGDPNFPLFYIINAYLNPLNSSQNLYFLSSIIIGLFSIFIFFKILLIISPPNINRKEIFLSASLIFLLPFYISRVYFGTSANLGWLFFLISLYFFIKNFENENFKKIYLIYVCIFSALALYCRPALVFFPLIFLSHIFFLNRNLNNLLVVIITYFILAIPGICIIYIWLSNSDLSNIVTSPWAPSNVRGGYYHYTSYLKNIPIISSYFLFYLIPLILYGLKEKYFKFTKSDLLIFILFFIIQIILFEIICSECLSSNWYGGGVFLKINNLFLSNNYTLFIFFSSAGLLLVINILKQSFLKNSIIIVPLFLVYGLSNGLYQDYFEPLIIFLIFSNLLTTNYKDLFFKKIEILNKIYFFYFAIYLFGSLFYQNLIA